MPFFAMALIAAPPHAAAREASSSERRFEQPRHVVLARDMARLLVAGDAGAVHRALARGVGDRPGASGPRCSRTPGRRPASGGDRRSRAAPPIAAGATAARGHVSPASRRRRRHECRPAATCARRHAPDERMLHREGHVVPAVEPLLRRDGRRPGGGWPPACGWRAAPRSPACPRRAAAHRRRTGWRTRSRRRCPTAARADSRVALGSAMSMVTPSTCQKKVPST